MRRVLKIGAVCFLVGMILCMQVVSIAEDAANKSDRSIAEGALKVRNNFKFPLQDYLYVVRSGKGTKVLENREYVQLVLDSIKGKKAAADQLARAATFPVQLQNNAEVRLPERGTKSISATVRSHFQSGLPSAISAGGREVELFDLSFVEIERSSTKASPDTPHIGKVIMKSVRTSIEGSRN